MAIDASIPLQGKLAQIEPDSNRLARALAIQNAAQTGQMNAMQMQRAQEEQDRQNELRRFLSSGNVTPEALYGRGYLTEGRQLAETNAKVNKDQRDSQKAQLEIAGSKLKIVGQVLGAAKDQTTWNAGRQVLAQNGIDISHFPEQFDPQGAQIALNQAIDAAKRIDQELAQSQFQETGRHNQVTEETGRANTRIAQGQLSVSQFNSTKPQFVPAADGNVYVGDVRRGTLTPAINPATGKPVEIQKQPNGDQSNAALYSKRMFQADQILNTTAYNPVHVAALQGAQNVPLVGGVTGAVANSYSSPEVQMVDQAQRDFINATLRRESGAAISPTEFDSARKQYFPQPGDSPQVIEQKARNRRTAIEGINNAAGPAKNSFDFGYGKNPGQGAPTGAPADAAQNVARPKSDAEYAALPPGTLYLAPDGNTRQKR